MKLQSDDYGFASENQIIANNFTLQNILRIGGKLRMNPFVLRAGYAHHSQPFASMVNDGSREVFTAGIGIMQQDFFLDLGYSWTLLRENFFPYPYHVQQAQPVEKTYYLNRFNLTAGFRFKKKSGTKNPAFSILICSKYPGQSGSCCNTRKL